MHRLIFGLIFEKGFIPKGLITANTSLVKITDIK